ncbi:hypothetical protein QUF76_11720 [Desulfobacterales bacterium HSG16]|nr:hypothetical protein [Desulfobacterales bacterium HSG16]
MKFYQSIRFMIVSTILLSGILLITLNSGIIFFVMGHNLSRMINNLLETEVDSFMYKYEKDRATPCLIPNTLICTKGFTMCRKNSESE